MEAVSCRSLGKIPQSQPKKQMTAPKAVWQALGVGYEAVSRSVCGEVWMMVEIRA
jgi:hypothetical protein